MGEVYRARDTRLDRTVAIKVLPEHLSANPQLRERFEREAKAISSLSHPHICPLYDVGHQGGIDFLVMEYLEGETLAQRLKKGPLAAEQVLQYAVQIADALDTAHRRGVIHRDLKPGNIMLVKTGAKLLDFGLAKVRAAETPAGMTALPTQTTPLTGEGTILGTLQYMAPEQLEGADADARTDLFALGSVLYEMATGRKAFAGKSQASVISAIMTADPPPISTLQPLTTPALDHVIRTCLAKDPDARWQTAHDVLVELKWIADAGSQAGVPKPVAARRHTRKFFLWALLAAVSLFAVILAFVQFRQRPAEGHTMRFQVPLPEKMSMDSLDFPVISPDGQRLIIPGIAADGTRHLWLRSLDSLTYQLLPETEGAVEPFWSPDNRAIAFFTNSKLMRIEAAGGPALTICDVTYPNVGGAWNRDGVILFSGTWGAGIFRVSATGGEPRAVLQLDKSRQETGQLTPQFLPDGRHFIYSSQAGVGKGGIYTGSLDSKETWRLSSAASNASYAPPGFLIYGLQETVVAHSFDPARLQIIGDAVPIAAHAGRFGFWPLSLYSVSQSGVLAYRGPEVSNVQFAWHDRDGRLKNSVGEPGIYETPNLSPDERRLALTRTDPSTGKADIWILELSNGIYTRVTFHSSADAARWSPDGRELLITQNPNGHMDIYRKEIGGGDEELVLQSDKEKWGPRWLGDNSALFNGGSTAYRLSLSGATQPVLLFDSGFDITTPVVTSDGRWAAYMSKESGRPEIHVAAFPSFKQKRQVSNGGGCAPHWRKDGKELFYLGLDGKMRSVDLKGESALETSPPRVLFQTGLRVDADSEPYEVTGDGKRFLYGEPVGETNVSITVVLNWAAGLKR
jgi:eukaryotic-like serine/threonine-protein kinase